MRSSRLRPVSGAALLICLIAGSATLSAPLDLTRLPLPNGGDASRTPPSTSPRQPVPAVVTCTAQPPGAIVSIPQGSGLSCGFDLKDPPFLIEHFSLDNFLSWEIGIQQPTSSMTLTSGFADILDAQGNPISPGETIDVQRFEKTAYAFGEPLEKIGICRADDTIACVLNSTGSDENHCGATGDPTCDPRPTAGFIPPNLPLRVHFPREFIGHNVVPAFAELTVCFDEYRTSDGECDPLIARVPLAEYRPPEGQSYIYPLLQPSRDEDGDGVADADRINMYVAHEIGTHHRLGDAQRFAYDIGASRSDGSTRYANEPRNDDHLVYGEPIVAITDARVVNLETGHPENPEPPAQLPGAGGCVSRTCAGQPSNGSTDDKCDVGDPADPTDDVFPGSGNSLILWHDPQLGGNGEFSGYAHMITGSNDHLSCGDVVRRGEVLGQVGNSGSSSGPHIHFSSAAAPDPEDPAQHTFPGYYTNVSFASPGRPYARRQLDVGIRDDQLFEILDPPAPLPRNAPAGPGNAVEQEPNDVLSEHDALELPVVVSATLENAEVGDLAVRGDGIEDVFRFDLAAPDAVRVELDPASSSGNLDVYVLTEDLRVLNPTREGTRQSGAEQVCLADGDSLDAGAYYVMVTNVDTVRSADVDYQLTIESDPEAIACTVTAPQPIAVDEACEAEVPFEIAIHDTCCLSSDTLNLSVEATNPTDNATVGEPIIDSIDFVSERDAIVRGRVPVSDVESCPAEVWIEARAADCRGNELRTQDFGTGCRAEVIDDTAPEVTSDIAAELLWPPDHELVSVGFRRTATDNCDADVGQSLQSEIWSDEAEMSLRGAPFSPDAKNPNGNLRLRRERAPRGDGRVYLALTGASDACGNVDWSCAASGVAHDQSGSSLDGLGSQMGTALGICEATGAAPADFHLQGTSPAIGPKQ